MKALLYKELKLAMHPICYIFVAAFPLMILIPNYPYTVSFIYILSCYPVLFLGANKGQQSNDLLFSTLLPVRKKDIVLARIATVALMHFGFILIMSALYPLGVLINSLIVDNGGKTEITCLPFEGYVSVLAIALIGYSLADLIFFPIYYKNGKSIVMSTLLTILGFVIYIVTFTIVLPFIPVVGEGYMNFLSYSGLGIQFGLLGGALALYIAIHYLVYRVSAKRLERVDF